MASYSTNSWCVGAPVVVDNDDRASLVIGSNIV